MSNNDLPDSERWSRFVVGSTVLVSLIAGIGTLTFMLSSGLG
jgi:hypothetical protein